MTEVYQSIYPKIKNNDNFKDGVTHLYLKFNNSETINAYQYLDFIPETVKNVSICSSVSTIEDLRLNNLPKSLKILNVSDVSNLILDNISLEKLTVKYFNDIVILKNVFVKVLNLVVVNFSELQLCKLLIKIKEEPEHKVNQYNIYLNKDFAQITKFFIKKCNLENKFEIKIDMLGENAKLILIKKDEI